MNARLKNFPQRVEQKTKVVTDEVNKKFNFIVLEIIKVRN